MSQIVQNCPHPSELFKTLDNFPELPVAALKCFVLHVCNLKNLVMFDSFIKIPISEDPNILRLCLHRLTNTVERFCRTCVRILSSLTFGKAQEMVENDRGNCFLGGINFLSCAIQLTYFQILHIIDPHSKANSLKGRFHFISKTTRLSWSV